MLKAYPLGVITSAEDEPKYSLHNLYNMNQIPAEFRIISRPQIVQKPTLVLKMFLAFISNLYATENFPTTYPFTS